MKYRGDNVVLNYIKWIEQNWDFYILSSGKENVQYLKGVLTISISCLIWVNISLEPLGKYHKIETIKTLKIYISA